MTRRVAIVLAASIGLNLFLLGFMVARAALRPAWGHHPMGPQVMAGPEAMLEGFDPPLREAMERHMGPRRARFDQDRQRIRDARRAVGQALGQDPLDTAALETAFGQLRTATTDSQAALHATLIEAAKDMSADQRRSVIERWTKHRRHRGPWHHGRRAPAADEP